MAIKNCFRLWGQKKKFLFGDFYSEHFRHSYEEKVKFIHSPNDTLSSELTNRRKNKATLKSFQERKNTKLYCKGKKNSTIYQKK
jgi:hypothetical protein